MYARVAYDLARCVNKVAVAELVDFLMQIAQSLWSGKECVTALGHRECACVGRLSVELQPVVEHTQYTVNNAYIVSCIFKDRTLLDVSFKHIHISVGWQAVLLVALEARLVKCFTECRCIVKDTLWIHHILIFELASDIFRQIIVTYDTRTHHSGRIQRAFLVCPYHSGERMLMGDVLLV